MGFFDEIPRYSHEQVPLPPGSYGSNKEPGLEIVNYNENGSKLDKSGAMRHSFLVKALKPSREAARIAKDATSFGELDFEGTAFLTISLHEMWLNTEASALAVTSENMDCVAKAIANGETSAESVEKARAYFRQIATDKVITANTSTDKLEEAIDEQYQKELSRIRIELGRLADLLDWKGVPRSLQFDIHDLVDTQFSGKIEAREFNGQVQSEVARIYSKKIMAKAA